MDIAGIGVDIVEISRIKKVLERKKERFTRRLFTDDECKYCERFKNKAERYAARFAAKEAVRKAISPLYKGYFNYREIEVIKSADGMPVIRLHGKLTVLEDNGAEFIVSLSHEHDYAVAFVIMQVKRGSNLLF